ncbi:MAG: hypothetical protein ABWW70_04695 [Thermoproteota archaeon]
MEGEAARECVERFARLRGLLPRASPEQWELYLIEWARFKRAAAEAAGECLKRLFPGIVKRVYYIDLSASNPDDYTGRDVDLLVEVDEKALDEGRSLEDTLEAILTKLAKMAGVDYERYNWSQHLFEVHTLSRGVYASKRFGNVIRVA